MIAEFCCNINVVHFGSWLNRDKGYFFDMLVIIWGNVAECIFGLNEVLINNENYGS